MSTTTCVTVPARPASRSAAVAAAYATLTAITFSAVSAAPTPIYRFYREALGLTPFTITLIFAAYSFTMIAAFLTIARLSDYVGRKPMILLALGLNAVALLLFFVAESAGTLVACASRTRGGDGRCAGDAWRAHCRYGAAMGRHAQQRDGVHGSRARRAHFGRVRHLCALADASRLCGAARRDARRDCRPRLGRRNDLAKGRRLGRNETQTDRAESRGRRDGAAFPADPLRLGARRISTSR